MTTHLGVLILFAAAVSAVFGTLLRSGVKEELRLAGRIFIALVVGGYVLGWLMYAAFG
jgi:undecaprenyl pyrophosphate phosphatase UppP